MLKSLDDRIIEFDEANEELANLMVKKILCRSVKEQRRLKNEIFKVEQKLKSAGNKIVDYALVKEVK